MKRQVPGKLLKNNTMKKYLYILYLFIITTSISGQNITKLESPLNKGGNLSSCNGFILLPGFSFKASSTNNLTLKIDKLICTPWINKITDSDKNGNPDQFLIDKQREIGEIPINSNLTSMGSLTYSVPIDIYPGRSDMKPNISLVYNSLGRNGVAGMGWNIGGLSSVNITNSSIYYDNKTKAASRDKESAYTLDGVRLISLGEGKYQSEQGNILVKSYASSNLYYFEVFYPNGNKATYGYKSSVAKVSYPLTRMEDRLGNYIEYVYDENNSIYYISQINYGANASSGHFASVKFSYTERKDITSAYIDGLEVKQNKILKQIDTYYNTTLLKSYVLGYEEKDITFLRQVDCVADGKTVNPLIFYYGEENTPSFDITSKTLKGYTAYPALNVLTTQFNPIGARNGLIIYPQKSSYKVNSSDGSISSEYNDKDSIYIYKDISKQDAPNKIQIRQTSTDGGTFRNFFVADIDGSGKDVLIEIASKITSVFPRGGNAYKIEDIIFGYYDENMKRYDAYKVSVGGIFESLNKASNPLSKSYLIGDFLGDGKKKLFIIDHSKNVLGQYRIANGVRAGATEYDSKASSGKSYANLVDFFIKGTIYSDECFAVEPGDALFALDFDGDGKDDICHINKSGGAVYSFDVNGGFVKIASIGLPSWINTPSMQKFEVGDLNGDGKMDFIVSPLQKIISKRFVHQGTCYGCCKQLPFGPDDILPSRKFPIVADCKDQTNAGKVCTITGVEEYVYSGGGDKWTTYYSNGNSGFTRKENSIVEYNFGDDFYLQDVDNDGLPDLVHVNEKGEVVAFINENGVVSNKSLFITNVERRAKLALTNIQDAYKMTKLITISGSTLTSMSFKTNRSIDRMLTEVVTSSGVIHRNTYKSLINSDVYSLTGTQAAYPNNKLYADLGVVSNSSSYYNNQKLSSNTYKYTNAIIHRLGLGFRGYEQIVTTDDVRDISSTQTFEPINFGILKQSDSPLTSAIYNYTINVADNKITKITLDNKTEKDKLKDISITSTYEYDSYGNPKKETINFGGGVTSVTDSKLKDINTETLYLLGLPEEQSVTNTRGGTSVVTKTTFGYNNKYLPTSKLSYYNSNQTAEEAYDYDTAWNLKELKSRSYTSTNWIINTYLYDSYGRLSKKTNPIGLYIEYGYNAKGLLETTKNHKGHITKTEYDRWGRSIKTTYPDGIVETSTLAWANSPTGALIISTTTATGQPDTQTYIDALGREIRKGVKRFDGQYLYTDNVYDSKGHLEKTSLPFKGASASLWNTYKYDNYDRLTSLSYASGKQDSYSYDKNKVTATVDDVAKTSSYDASGQVINVVDPAGTITYNYRPDGQLSSIIAPGDITTSFGYDSYGRQTSIVDPSAGTKTFGYDIAGNTNYEKDARGKVTNMLYDSFNRIEKKEIVGEQTITYKYNENNGELSSISSTNGTGTSYIYDNLLRLSEEKETIVDGKWLQKTLSYANGNLSSILYKSQSGDIVTENYTYSNGHHTETKLNNTTPVWKLTAENTMGMPTASTTGVLNRTYGYDNYGLPTSRVIKNGTTVIQNYGYNFSAQTGNLNWRKDNTRNIQENFNYDGLNRLTTINNISSTAYDIKGNTTSKTGIGTFEYKASNKPYAVTEITLSNGITQPSHTIAYNNMMRPSSITEGSVVTSFTYNGDANRVKMHVKNNGVDQLQRYYIGNQYEMDIRPTGSEERLYLDGDAYSAAAVYVRQGTGAWQVQYIGRDYLGSITHVMDATGVVKQELSYDPWGRLRNPVNQALYDLDNRLTLVLGDRGYTGHEHLTNHGLINMNARLYDPVVGRFLSPDPYVQAPSMSQNFNRYSYALNNPLRYTDPNGEFFNFVVGGLIGGVFNLGFQALTGQIHSLKDGLVSFGIGALAGATGVGAGGLISGVGFISGAASGGLGGFASGAIVGAGNTWTSGSSFTQGLGAGLKGGIMGAATGAIIGGTVSGINSVRHGGNFFTGKGYTRISEVISTNVGGDKELNEEWLNGFKDELDWSPSKYGISKMEVGVDLGSISDETNFFTGPDGIIRKLNPKNGTTSTIGGITTQRSNGIFRFNTEIHLSVHQAKDGLRFTLNHELIHAYHYSLGLSMANDGAYSEYSAYSYSASYASNNQSFYLGKLTGQYKWYGAAKLLGYGWPSFLLPM